MIYLNGVPYNIEEFPNKESRLPDLTATTLLASSSENPHLITLKYEDDRDLTKLYFLKSYMDQVGIKDVELKILYMPYSRMDRSEKGSAFTLKYVAELINLMKFNKVLVIEPHSDMTCALLDNSEPHYVNFELLPKVQELVGFGENDYIMFPDTGAGKRYKDLKTNNVLIGHKVRDFQTGDIKRLDLMGEREKQGKKVIIVDDLSSRGGTFVHSSIKLKEIGFEEVYLLVAHAENAVFDGELFDHIDKLFTTHTILSKENYWSNAKYKDKIKIFNV